MDYQKPVVGATAFNCPFCHAFSQMNWFARSSNSSRNGQIQEVICSRCNRSSIWRITDITSTPAGFNLNKGEMVYPQINTAPPPGDDMPNEVMKDYNEAASVLPNSSKAAAALLRLGLQKLCIHLGEKGENINADIRSLSSKGVVPPTVITAADTLRITGNCAVHPGEMSDSDIDDIAEKLFSLLNYIVKRAITDPKEVMAIYGKTPEKPRIAAENKDSKSKK